MKKFFLLLVLFTLIIGKGVSEEVNTEKEVEDRLYKSYLEETIPEKFVEPFFDMTKDLKSIGIEILGLGFHESHWKDFIGKVNKNGSIDIGPLMLNSYNIANSDFMRRYGKNSDDYKYDTDVYYMTICITFFKALRVEYGTFNALKVYNGGPKVMRDNCSKELKKTVTTYANVVYKEINKCASEWKAYKEEKREVIIAEMEREKEEQIAKEKFIQEYKERMAQYTKEAIPLSTSNSHLYEIKKNLVYISRKEEYYFRHSVYFLRRRFVV